jgi:hypothetical protein
VKDPFALKAGTIIAPGVVQAEQYGVYRYDSTEPLSLLPDASLTWNHHRAAAKNYSWWLYSYGPSRDAQSSAGAYRMYAEYIIGASWHPLDIYDPTNGTVSHGMIIRTNKGEYTGQDYGPL